MAMHLRRLITPLLAAAFVVGVGAACNPLSSGTDPTPTRAAATIPADKQFKAPDQVLKPGKLYFVTLQTDVGDMTFQLLPEHAPDVVNSFVFLAQKGFYDRLIFFRVEKGSFAQTGDPTNRGSSSGPGYSIDDDQNNLANVRGTISMGKAARDNKVGSQFFINTGDNPSFDGDRVDFRRLNPFGMIVAGEEILDLLNDTVFVKQAIITEQDP